MVGNQHERLNKSNKLTMARKATYDQDTVKELRMSVIEASLMVMTDDPKVESWSAYKKELILKIAPRVLPTVNEHSGPDGGAIQISGVDIVVRK